MIVYKYEIELESEFEIQMHKGAKILKVDAQRGIPQMWALLDETALTESRKFIIFGTGHKIRGDKEYSYLGTFILDNGAFVGHLFEKV